MIFKRRMLSKFIKAAPMLAMAGAVGAQGGASGPVLEEVIVSAQKREENLQQTPLAISAYSAEVLDKLGITDISSLVAKTPSVYSTPYPLTNSILTLFMRGQGNADPLQITKDGSIGIYENGIYNSRPQTIIFDLADVEQVEVLRGPQGTLYGRNTTGGAMNVVSKAPTGEFGVRQLISVGDRHQVRSVTNIDLPEVVGFSTKLTLVSGHDDGYVENIGSGKNYNYKDNQGARLAVLWQASDNIAVDYGYTWADVKSTPGYLTNPSLNGVEVLPGIPYKSTKYETYRPVDLRESTVKVSDQTLTVTWDISGDFTIKSLTGLRQLDGNLYSDTPEAYGIGVPIHDDLESDQFSQEFQLIGSLGQRVDYVAGLYYFDEDSNHRQDGHYVVGTFDSPFDRYVTADAKSYAAYGQLTWTPPVLDDQLSITVGVRETKDKREAVRDYTSGGFVIDASTPFDKSFSRFNPTATVAYNISDTLSTYGKVATGYRSGGASESSSDFRQGFGPETLTTYEVGMKADWLDRRLRTNIAVFYSDYKDIQLGVLPDASNINIVQTYNAGQASISGLEADILLAATDDLQFSLGYSYLDTEVKKASVPGTSITAGDFVIPYAPENSVNLGMDWTILHFTGGSLSTALNYAWKDSVYNTSGAGKDIPGRDFFHNDPYGFLDGKITVQYQTETIANPVKISLWGRNLLDKRVPIFTSAIGSAAQGYSSSVYNYAEPLTAGVEASFSF
jgi:iron complex outermembrane receptor protein